MNGNNADSKGYDENEANLTEPDTEIGSCDDTNTEAGEPAEDADTDFEEFAPVDWPNGDPDYSDHCKEYNGKRFQFAAVHCDSVQEALAHLNQDFISYPRDVQIITAVGGGVHVLYRGWHDIVEDNNSVESKADISNQNYAETRFKYGSVHFDSMAGLLTFLNREYRDQFSEMNIVATSEGGFDIIYQGRFGPKDRWYD